MTVTSRVLISPPPETSETTVAVSILPQQYFVRKVGGERVSVLVMAGPGLNPLTCEPPEGQFKFSDAPGYEIVAVDGQRAFAWQRCLPVSRVFHFARAQPTDILKDML